MKIGMRASTAALLNPSPEVGCVAQARTYKMFLCGVLRKALRYELATALLGDQRRRRRRGWTINEGIFKSSRLDAAQV